MNKSEKRKNILVFPCGSETGLDIYRSVQYEPAIHLVGASSVDDHGRLVYEDYIGGLPYYDRPECEDVLLRIIKEHEIDAVWPTMDAVNVYCKEREERFGVPVISPSLETVRICQSKRRTAEALRDVLRTAREYTRDEVTEDLFPLFVKPESSYGSRGTRRVADFKALDGALAERNDLMILEYLPGEEYTVDCFTDGSGVLRYCRGRKRVRIKSGISTRTEFAKEQADFREMAERIVSRLSLRGAWFFQVKRDREGILCLLEVGARIAGSSGISRAMGVNLPLLTIRDRLGLPLTWAENACHVLMDRSLNEVYLCDIAYQTVCVRLQGTLLLDDQVNTELAAYLYQCVNAGRKLFLIAEEAEQKESEELARRHRLWQLFDGMGTVAPDGQLMREGSPIDGQTVYIDHDAERRERVAGCMGIPVFGPDTIQALMR